MELFIAFLGYFGHPAKLSAKDIKEGIDVFFLIVSGCIMGGYLLSYIVFSQMHKVKNIEIREIFCDFGKLGLGILIVGHIAFLGVFSLLGNFFQITQPIDNFIHLFFIGLMVFYVYYCNKQLSYITFTKSHYR
jgi:hypothetical protein